MESVNTSTDPAENNAEENPVVPQQDDPDDKGPADSTTPPILDPDEIRPDNVQIIDSDDYESDDPNIPIIALNQDDESDSDLERQQRLDDIREEVTPCTCPANSFDKRRIYNPYLISMMKKLMQLPRCMHYRVYRDIMVYVRYSRHKHRRMLLRAGDPLPTC